jgi:hypothetical protein
VHRQNHVEENQAGVNSELLEKNMNRWRQHKRAYEKKERRNRHYVKLLIKQQTS